MANEVVVTTDDREFGTIVTAVGNAKVANAALNGKKVNIIEMAVGDGNGAYYLPTDTQTGLAREVWRGEIAYKEIDADSPNMINVKGVLPTDVGGFTVREAGLFDDEGDMIAVANLPATDKAVILQGISAALDILLHVVFSNTDAVNILVNPNLDSISRSDLDKAIEEHNADPDAHADVISMAVANIVQDMIDSGQMLGGIHVIAERERDSGKPTYGLGGGGEDGGEVSVALDAESYTGDTEIGVVVSGTLYDANNMSANGDTAPDGTIIIKTEE